MINKPLDFSFTNVMKMKKQNEIGEQGCCFREALERSTKAIFKHLSY